MAQRTPARSRAAPERRSLPTAKQFIHRGREVVDIEAAGVAGLSDRIDERFAAACALIAACSGRVVVTGMGKSGHVGGKIAATLASTGTPAFFVHPGEASHGDLGMITPGDVVIALSNSGETEEVLTLLPMIKRIGVPLVALTGNSGSTLARAANVNIDVSVEREACPMGLAPTSSTTAALVMGDAIAIALLETRNFSEDDFARSHPGGVLGRRLLLHVADIMHTGEAMPAVTESMPLTDALLEMTRKGLGTAAIVGADGKLLGIFTDGDLRRVLDRGLDVRTLSVGAVMTRNCRTIGPGALAAEAVAMMEAHKINALPVVDPERRLIGVLNMHDLLRAKVV
jgi:arabinose-5-phosphate isomerase